MTTLSPSPIQHFVDNNDDALVGGKLFVYLAGTTTKTTTYTDVTGATPQTNPIILNARGEPENNSNASIGIWLTTGQAVKMVLSPSTDTDPPTNPIWTVDQLMGGQTIPTTAVANIAALRALTSSSVIANTINVEGYYSVVDGGEGLFSYKASDTTSSDNGGTIIVDMAPRRWYRQLSGARVTPKQFGCYGNGSTDDTTTFNAWKTYVLNTGYPADIGQGDYILSGSSAITLDLVNIALMGTTITGAGYQQAILDVQAVTATPQLQVICSGEDGADYFQWTGFGVKANTSGVAFQLGKADYSDPLNDFNIACEVQNFSTAGTARAVEVNYVLGSNLWFSAQTAGASYALTVRQAAFCTFGGTYSSAAGDGTYLTAGFIFGNTFLNCDNENVANCVVIDSDDAVNNVWLGGQFSYNTADGTGIFATAGQGNVFIAPNAAPVSPATDANMVSPTGYIGVTVLAPGAIGVTTPAMPASGTAVTNTTGQQIFVTTGSETITSIAINGVIQPTTSGGYILAGGDTITPTYPGTAPAWLWKPFP